MVSRDYSEERELRKYIWNNYGHLQTALEHRLRMAAILELKARHAGSEEKRLNFRSMQGYWDHSDVRAIADAGLEVFEQAIVERILQEYSGQVVINRCEKCDRIVVSPISCTCLWCGHSWYDRRSEMEAWAYCGIYPPPGRTTDFGK